MNTEIKIAPDMVYLKAEVSGLDSREVSFEVMRRIVAACEEHNCFNVLVKAHHTNPLSVMESYNAPQILNEAGVTHKHRIAWVNLNPETYERTYFAETVLHNRGYTMFRLFKRVEDAGKWLFDKIAA